MRLPTAAELLAAKAAGLVRCVADPSNTMLIWNYTEECAWSGAWDLVTLQCRGLITRFIAEGEPVVVVARPWVKFFNVGEPACPVTNVFDVPGYVEITDKMDGSLGIIYPAADDRLAVATRGSFTSDQAVHATAVLRSKYAGWAPPEGVTVLVEIIYPENRIVVDYGKLDDLVFLGAVEIATGADIMDGFVEWPGPARDVYEMSLRTLLAEMETPSLAGAEHREGFVLAWPRVGGPALRAKLKYEHYVALHRVVTGLSTRVVWEALRDGTYDDLVALVPVDWQSAVVRCADDLMAEFRLLTSEVRRYHDAVVDLPDRKAQAQTLLTSESMKPYASLVFAMLDGKDIAPAVWRRIEPAYEPLKEG